MSEQTLPHNREAERILLKACITPGFDDYRETIINQVSLDDIYIGAHKEYYQSIRNLHAKSLFPEMNLLWEDIKRRGKARTAPLNHINQILDEETLPSNVDYYIETIKDLALKRRLAKFGNALWKKSVDGHNLTGADICDFAKQSFEAIEVTAITDKSRFEFVRAGELAKEVRPPEWQIHHIVPSKSFYYNYGDSQTFKTFAEIDRELCIASGVDYHGHKVRQGSVFFIAAEGQQGLIRRIMAWCIKHRIKLDDVPFFVGRVPAQLMDHENVDSIKRTIEAMTKEYGDPAAIHFDTLARNFGAGDENQAKDILTVVRNLDIFRDIAMRGVTHHSGHANKDRAKGSIALDQAADAAFRFRRNANGSILVENTKMKDSAKAAPMLFSTEIIKLQIGEVKADSVVLNLEAEGDEAIKAEVDVPTGQMGEALAILREMYRERESELAQQCGDPKIIPHISKYAWMKRCLEATLYRGRSDNLERAIAKMQKREQVFIASISKTAYPPEMLDRYEIDL